MIIDIKVEKTGRLVLTRRILKRCGMKGCYEILLCKFGPQIVLIPVNKYAKPTKTLYGSVKAEKRIDKPKKVARKHLRKQLQRNILLEKIY